MESLNEINSHADKNPATDSDRVKAPMASADSTGCGRSHIQTSERDGSPQIVNTKYGKRESGSESESGSGSGNESGASQTVSSKKGKESEVIEEGVFGRSQVLKRTPPSTRRVRPF